MELSKYQELSKIILDNEPNRFIEIYKITNLITNKSYVGQAVSHILNHERYRPYGKEGRFRCHISEAYSDKKKQCNYLNASIRKYGPFNFTVTLLEYCAMIDADKKEIFHIINENTLFPSGYNLYTGGNRYNHTLETRKNVSNGVKRYYKNRKFEKFLKLKSSDIDNEIEKYIKPLNREGKQYGWYVYIKKYKADFGGVHIFLDDSFNDAKEFIIELKNKLAKHLDAGNPLEPLTTTL